MPEAMPPTVEITEMLLAPLAVNVGILAGSNPTLSIPPAAPRFAELPPKYVEVSRVAELSFIADTRPVLSGKLKVVDPSPEP